MAHTQLAFADGAHDAPVLGAASDRVTPFLAPLLEPAPRISLGSELRLRGIPDLLQSIARVIGAGMHVDPGGPSRIELDASALRVLTEGARRVLLTATERLAARDIELVMVGCDPFERR
ncbi:MAG: hypothetical protein U0168_29310 [Nannocystaceae bacterium]